MRPTALFLALAFTGLTFTLAGGQTATPAAVSAAIRTHVGRERFQIVTAMRGLPLGVREELQRMFGSSAAAIADPDGEFQATDVINKPHLPIRRLVTAGCSQDHCLVYYERGGYAHVWQVVLFHWTPAGTRVEAGGLAPRGLPSVDAVRTALLSGAIKPTKFW